MTDREDTGEEAIKAAREKFAKSADDPAGIASAKVGSKSIKSSLDETDPQRKSQVMPQMYDQFGKIQNILKSSSTGQKNQNQLQIDVNQPDYYQDLDGDTKEMLTSALTYTWTFLTRNFGYKKVLNNIKKATTGSYTQSEAKDIGISANVSIEAFTYKFDMLSPDYQDVVTGSIILLSKLVEKYGEKKVPFLDPALVKKPKTHRVPPNLVKEPTKYSILEYYTVDELPEISVDGLTGLASNTVSKSQQNGFIYANNSGLMNGDIVKYITTTNKKDLDNLKSNTYYYVVSSNSSGFKVSKTLNGGSISIAPRANTGGTFYGLETYSGYAEWYKLNGEVEYMLRNEFLPDYDTPEMHVIYLSSYSMSYDLFPIVLNDKLDINFLAKTLDRYTRKLENDFMDYTLGWGMSTDNANNDKNWQDMMNGKSGGSQNNMLQQMLPQLKQMLEQAKSKHLMDQNTVLDKGKMQGLLKNLEQKKTENKRMSLLADSGIGAGGLGGLGGFGGIANIGNLGNMTGMGGFGNLLSGGTKMGGLSGMGSIFGGGDISGLMSSVSSISSSGSKSSSSATPTITPTAPTNTNVNTAISSTTYIINGKKVEVTQVVNDLYVKTFKREADQEGLLYWSKIFSNDVALYGYDAAYKRLVNSFKGSIEYKQKIQYEELKHIYGIEGLL